MIDTDTELILRQNARILTLEKELSDLRAELSDILPPMIKACRTYLSFCFTGPAWKDAVQAVVRANLIVQTLEKRHKEAA